LNQDIEYKETVSKEAIVLMKKMLQKTPNKRATANDVLEDSWINENE
jgi:serine/threonine protein kinase